MPQRPTSWVKVLVTLLLGFQLGLMLGFISSTLMFKLLPQQWIENGFADQIRGLAESEGMSERRVQGDVGWRAESGADMCLLAGWGFERCAWGSGELLWV